MCSMSDRLRPASPLRARRRRRGARGAAARPGRAGARAGPRAARGGGLGGGGGVRRPRRACGWGRRSRAARGWRSCRPTRSGSPTRWERVLVATGVDRRRGRAGPPGLACFDARGLRRLHGGSLDGVLAATREPRRAGVAARASAPAPSRFCALVAAAARARARRPGCRRAAPTAWPPSAVALLRDRHELSALPEPLERLGIATLGELAALPRAAVADRFGRAGLLAHELARGRDTPLRPRRPGERLEEVLELPESLVGRAARARARPARRPAARAARAARAHAARGRARRAAGRGRHLARARRRSARRSPTRRGCGSSLAPAPRAAARAGRGAAAGASSASARRSRAGARAASTTASARAPPRLREAVRQARAAAGPDAALRVLAVDPDSRVPERRAVLTPFEV